MVSNFGKWDYSAVDHVCYSDPTCESYKRAIQFLDDGTPIEDWGGGTGWAKRYVQNSTYRNIDGSPHPNVDEVVDLAKYTSSGNNILLRQVLGCAGDDWQKILRNAVRSFENKLCIVIGTPDVPVTEPVDNPSTIREIYFHRNDILLEFAGLNITHETIPTDQYYGEDWIIYVEKI